ncbi:hypothetical protein CAI21_14735 [Alkalilimnicola ehrlichii]|uniref:DUF2007 domain-containing protein n=1 Tax=Alkalilimnicola ehrlichii TaxID=351052 RepID=A0A3E0WN63_9GAMM|nr:DUF6164 family protein [Alkalilimnicola ehrlichii]RFA27295.1 hypothetical protein CAI21_14735 [Alkalilimnicola ehrlichii]RFA34404.1 hypothetical protein CAL65_15305 [Alkalilimnicola ehrlichii]
MAARLLNLAHLPEDEIAEIRELLEQHNIDFYETPPNRWGFNQGAIWLHDANQKPEAKRLLDEYQRERLRKARADYEERKRAGAVETIGDRFRQNPLRFVLYIAIIGAILYLTLMPFIHLITG